jgi:hypothetical protein
MAPKVVKAAKSEKADAKRQRRDGSPGSVVASTSASSRASKGGATAVKPARQLQEGVCRCICCGASSEVVCFCMRGGGAESCSTSVVGSALVACTFQKCVSADFANVVLGG